MNNPVFSEVTFNIGWKTKIEITLFGNKYTITVKAKAYFEKDGITPEQEIAFSNFKSKQTEQLQNVELLLKDYDKKNAATRFVPNTLLFQRDGEYALLLDDKEDVDDGIVVCLAPNTKVISQDEYL